MKQHYMYNPLSIIALSALRACSAFARLLDKESKDCYWRYMFDAIFLLGVSPNKQACAQYYCQAFINVYTQVTSTGQLLGISIETEVKDAHYNYTYKAFSILPRKDNESPDQH